MNDNKQTKTDNIYRSENEIIAKIKLSFSQLVPSFHCARAAAASISDASSISSFVVVGPTLNRSVPRAKDSGTFMATSTEDIDPPVLWQAAPAEAATTCPTLVNKSLDLTPSSPTLSVLGNRLVGSKGPFGRTLLSPNKRCRLPSSWARSPSMWEALRFKLTCAISAAFPKATM